jgi:hypothetical protein
LATLVAAKNHAATKVADYILTTSFLFFHLKALSFAKIHSFAPF